MLRLVASVNFCFSVVAFSLLGLAFGQDELVYGCGGFIKSSLPIDYGKIKLQLYTTSNKDLKYETECAPNGYYMIPVYTKGLYTIKIVVDPLSGWEFDPQEFHIKIDGVTDACTLGKDLNFNFKGFSVFGTVCNGPTCTKFVKGHEVGLYVKEGDTKPLMTSQTNEQGRYDFRGVSIGQYFVRHMDKSVCVPDGQTVRVTVTQTSFGVSSSLIIDGYGITGQVVDSGKPVENSCVFLYSTSNTKPKAKNCDIATPDHLSPQKDAPFVCSILTNQNGRFSFSCLEPGRYFTIAKYETNGLKFNVSPEKINFEIIDQSISLKDSFKLDGFSLTGRVLRSYGGKPMQGVDIFFDDQKLADQTDQQGLYHASKMLPGNHKILAVRQNFEFAPLAVDLSIKNHQIPDIIPTRLNLCGQFKMDKNVGDSKAVLQQRKLLLTDTAGKVSTVSITTDKNGKFCKMTPPGSYTLEPQILVEEKKAGFSVVPSMLQVVLKDEPILDVIFDQFKAKLSGVIKCLDTCEGVKLKLYKTADQKTVLKYVDVTIFASSHTFEFDGILNSKYTVEIVAPKYCWKTTRLDFSVDNANVENLIFEQNGFTAALSMSHGAKLTYKLLKNPAVCSSLQLHKGLSSFCLPVAGDYEFKFESCHTFDGTSGGAITYSTTSKNQHVLNLVANKHTVKGIVKSLENLADLSIHIGLTSDLSDMVIPVILRQNEKPSENAQKTYDFEYVAGKHAKIQIQPKSAIFLFEPEKSIITVEDDCIENVDFNAQKGQFLLGTVEPALEGVEITVTSESDPLVQYETTTDAKGVYNFGPLKTFSGFKIEAQKAGYVLTHKDRKFGQFSAFKLSELTLKTVDIDRQALPGVLLSLSGKNYRSNNITGENGTITFVGLTPGEYFIKPILKEYAFEPTTQLVNIDEGSTLTVELSGKRFAFSCTGTVRHLAGQPVPNVGVEAVPHRGQCHTPSQQQAAHEEAVTLEDGSFKIRGLLPGCSYNLQFRPGQNIPATVPVKHLVTVTDRDSLHNDFILKPVINTLEVAGRVDCDKNLLQYLKVVICKSSSPESPLHTILLQTSSVFFFPMLPIDNTVYIVRLENSLSSSQYELFEQQDLQLKANTSFHFVNFRFEPKKKSHEQEHSRGSYLAIPLTVLLLLIAYNHEQLLKSSTQFFFDFSLEPNSHLSKILQKFSGQKVVPSRKSSPNGSSDPNGESGAENSAGFLNRKRTKLRKT